MGRGLGLSGETACEEGVLPEGVVTHARVPPAPGDTCPPSLELAALAAGRDRDRDVRARPEGVSPLRWRGPGPAERFRGAPSSSRGARGGPAAPRPAVRVGLAA